MILPPIVATPCYHASAISATASDVNIAPHKTPALQFP